MKRGRSDWWLVAGGWWLVAGGWWLVAGGWWLVLSDRELVESFGRSCDYHFDGSELSRS
jgi:hypothetical protein